MIGPHSSQHHARPSKPEGSPFLGITAKSAARGAGQENRDLRPDGARANRYRLQRRAQGLLKGERVARCHRGLSGEQVTVKRASDGFAHYSGLVTCGSVWHCPVCAAKVTETRRKELQTAMAEWISRGGEVYLVTYTHRHHAGMQLEAQMQDLAGALSKLKATRSYKGIMQRAGSVGAVRALEVTHGEDNGWHPHVHELVFARRGALDVLQEIRAEWGRVHLRVFGTTISQAGFDVQNGDYAAEYVAKFGHEPDSATWTASHEVTKGHTKIGKRLSGRTPFTLLDLFDHGNKRAGELFTEYAHVFKGRRQLFWSRGLRDELKLSAELTDEEIAAQEEAREEHQTIAVLDLEDWRAVMRHNARAEVLLIAEQGGPMRVREFIDTLRRTKGRWSGVFEVKRYFGRGYWMYEGMGNA